MDGGGQTTTTQNTYPAGYEDQLARVYAKSNEVANLPFTQYTDDRVADLSPDTLAAMNLARQSIGSTDQINQQALDALNEYAGYSGLETGIQALDSQGNPQNYSNLDIVSPLVGNALPSLNSSSASYTQNLLDQYGANKTVPDVIQNYLNPYTRNVLDQLASAGARNLTESIIPNINSTFIGGGAFGGSRNNEFMSRAIRDTQDSILAKQLDALNTQYNTAAGQAQSDLARLTGTAENLGGQYGTDLSRNISGTQTLSDILSRAGTSDADRRTAAAQYLQSLGATDAANALTASNALQSYGTNIYNQNLKDASIIEGIGQTQQQQEQNEINAAIAAFNEANNYPREQLDILSSPLKSINVQPSSTTSTTTSGGGSPFGQILGGLVGLSSLAVPGAGGVSAAGNILSDRRMKKNINRLGTARGRKGEYPLYRYEYKGTSQPHIGVMAQDVEKRNPSAVKEFGGMKTVDYKKLATGGLVGNYQDHTEDAIRALIAHYAMGGYVDHTSDALINRYAK